MSKPIFRFTIGRTDNIAFPAHADRVALAIGHISGGVMTSLDMPATEARAMANALYEAADASDKMLPVAAAGVAA